MKRHLGVFIGLIAASVTITSCSNSSEEISYQPPTSESVKEYLNDGWPPGCGIDVCVEIKAMSVESTDKPWVWCANLVSRAGTPFVNGSVEGVTWDEPTSSRKCYRITTDEQGVIESAEYADGELGLTELTDEECAQLSSFAEQDLADKGSNATYKFWDLEQGVRLFHEEVSKTYEVGTEDYEYYMNVGNAGIEERRQGIADEAGAFSQALTPGNLKIAMENLAQGATAGSLRTMRDLAESCNLTSD